MDWYTHPGLIDPFNFKSTCTRVHTEGLLGEEIDRELSLAEVIRDGVLLCRIIKAIDPDLVPMVWWW